MSMVVEVGNLGTEKIAISEQVKRSARRLITVISNWRQERIYQIELSNPYGFETPGFKELSEEGKKLQWIEQGGKDFIGTAGEIKRYVVGIPTRAVDSIRNSGFDVHKKTSLGATLPFLGGTEGKGVYATTNPELASREYGPALAVVDIALGKSATADKSLVLSLLNNSNELVRMMQASYAASVGAYEILSTLVVLLGGNWVVGPSDALLTASAVGTYLSVGAQYKIFQEKTGADSMIIKPNVFPTVLRRVNEIVKGKQLPGDFLSKVERHKEWVVVKDSNRVKVVGVFNDYQKYRDKEPELLLRPGS